MKDNRTTFGAKIMYTCHENYTLIGHEERTCGGDGEWSESSPQCLFDWCPDPPSINGGVVTTTGRRAGDTATYSCQSGYILFGQGVSIKQQIIGGIQPVHNFTQLSKFSYKSLKYSINEPRSKESYNLLEINSYQITPDVILWTWRRMVRKVTNVQIR